MLLVSKDEYTPRGRQYQGIRGPVKSRVKVMVYNRASHPLKSQCQWIDHELPIPQA